MQISKDDLFKAIRPGALHQIGIHNMNTVYQRITKFYCSKLTVRSACPQKCDTCILRVRERIESTDWSTSTAPYGLLVWIVKTVSAEAVEAANDKQKEAPAVVAFEDAQGTDDLDELMCMLS